MLAKAQFEATTNIPGLPHPIQSFAFVARVAVSQEK